MVVLWESTQESEAESSGHYDENQNVNLPTSRYFYDGQMCMEEDYNPSQISLPQISVTRYGLGARGIDYIESVPYGSSAAVSFPIYDGHGNMIATISRTSGPGFQTGNERRYDAWGGIRGGSTTGAPKQRYCGNLGHVQDDESGLIYMRARYYEPGMGRFVSEDPAMQGLNWTVYCGNDPINKLDVTGGISEEINQLVNSIWSLLKQFGLDTVASLALRAGARSLGATLFAMSSALISTGFWLNSIAMSLSVGGPIARTAAAVVGWFGARACAAGLAIQSVAMYIMVFGGIDLDGTVEFRPPDDIINLN